MGKVLVTDTYLEDIADAIREKLGVATTYKPSEMAAAILSISGGGTVTIKGAPSSTVTYTGDDSGSVSLDAAGEGSVILSGGTYTFTNTVTIGEDTFTAYTKTVAVAGNMTVELYPVGVIYWFGRMVTAISAGSDYEGLDDWNGVISMSAGDNCVYGTVASVLSQARNCMKWGSYGMVDTTGYSVLKARAVISWTTTGGNENKRNVWRFMSSKDLSAGVKTADIENATSDGTAAIEIMSLPATPGEYYIGGYAGYAYKAYHGVTMKILTIWME